MPKPISERKTSNPLGVKINSVMREKGIEGDYGTLANIFILQFCNPHRESAHISRLEGSSPFSVRFFHPRPHSASNRQQQQKLHTPPIRRHHHHLLSFIRQCLDYRKALPNNSPTQHQKPRQVTRSLHRQPLKTAKPADQ